MFPAFQRFILYLLTVSAVRSAVPAPGVEILPWRDGKAAALVLMFDDNLDSQRRHAVPELQKRGLTATFYVNPGRHGFQQNPFWQTTLPELGFDYGAHTMTHRVRNETDADAEIGQSAAILRQLLPPGPRFPLLSFGRPGGKGAFQVSRETEAVLLKKHQLISRDTPGLFMFTGQKLGDMERWLDRLIAGKSEGRICFHGVGGDYLSISLETFTGFLDAVAARRDRLWVAGHLPVHQYATIRATARPVLTASAAGHLTLQIQSAADPAHYDEPLTVRVSVPAGWTACRIRQAGPDRTVPVVSGAVVFAATAGSLPIILSPEQSISPAIPNP